jgi:hypothetical protein
MTWRVGVSMFLVQVMLGAPFTAQHPAPRKAVPVEPIAAIVDALRTHDVVALTDPHSNVQVQTFLLSLIGDPRFVSSVNDIVIETASARYQDAIDRFVRGDDVQRDVLRKAWEEHVVPNSLGVQAEEVIRAVRATNASLRSERRLRVIAGDPPIDWDNITSAEDLQRWVELRDSYPSDLIRRQVLDRGRRALVLYGQGHLQRRQILSNYDMSTWQSQTVVSLLGHDPAVRIFNVWTLLDSNVELPDEVASWHAPSLAELQGTSMGAKDFEDFSRGFGFGTRFGIRNGQLVPLPRQEWQTMRMEDQFSAILYLGPPSSMTYATVPAALCQDSRFVDVRVQRLKRFGPPVELENFKKACGLQ